MPKAGFPKAVAAGRDGSSAGRAFGNPRQPVSQQKQRSPTNRRSRQAWAAATSNSASIETRTSIACAIR